MRAIHTIALLPEARGVEYAARSRKIAGYIQ